MIVGADFEIADRLGRRLEQRQELVETLRRPGRSSTLASAAVSLVIDMVVTVRSRCQPSPLYPRVSGLALHGRCMA
jgi:hypothetical protein